jgi:hypothetical protein
MGKPDSRRFARSKPDSKPVMPWQESPAPAAPPVNGKPKTGRISAPKTTRMRAARSDSGDEGEENAGPSPAVVAARAREESRNQTMMIVGICAGVGLLLLVLIVAVSSGSSGNAVASENRRKKKVEVEAPPPPPPPRQSFNYVRNTGSIVFVCGGSDKHQDKEIVVGDCPACPEKNQFEVAQDAGGYRCVKCKGVVQYADLKCDSCGKVPRVTHLKKVLPTNR